MASVDLRFLQLKELDLLLEFRRVCTLLGLRYYVTAGTLLGAVRHKGFIPWDDDIDVVMPRADYDKLAKLAPYYISSNCVYQEYHTERNFPYYFAKLRERDTQVEEPILRGIQMEQGYYIDIFPLDRCPHHDRLAKWFFKAIELLDCAVLAQVSNEFECGYQKFYARLLWNALRYLPRNCIFILREQVRKISGVCGQKLCTVGGSHGWPRESYLPSWFEGTIQVEFEGYHFPAPIGWDELLHNMYGDYMLPPSPDDRCGHFVKEETSGERKR